MYVTFPLIFDVLQRQKDKINLVRKKKLIVHVVSYMLLEQEINSK